jgi:hypothetical protein
MNPTSGRASRYLATSDKSNARCLREHDNRSAPITRKIRHSITSLKELIRDIMHFLSPEKELRKWGNSSDHFADNRPTEKLVYSTSFVRLITVHFANLLRRIRVDNQNDQSISGRYTRV